MEQAARECGINLVFTLSPSYSAERHGTALMQERIYDGQRRSVTEYTNERNLLPLCMKIEETGISEGILFIDEINCVSETLAPAMPSSFSVKPSETRQCRRAGLS